VVSLLRAARTPRADVERHDDWHIFQGNQYWNNVLSSWDPQHEGIGSDFARIWRCSSGPGRVARSGSWRRG
jgi:hypothetical protein